MHECPKTVIEAGRSLVNARKSAAKLEAELFDALEKVRIATKQVCDEHGALYMESGEAEKLLLECAAGLQNLKMAHNSLRKVLCECEISQPTNEQLKAASWR